MKKSYIEGKNILLGVTGSIAAYKIAFLVRLFIKAGADVKIIMTRAATEFITPLTLSALSKNPVLIDFTSKSASPAESEAWNNHVELAHWADVMLIAPASANTLSKMANGICDNLLLAAYLSVPHLPAVASTCDKSSVDKSAKAGAHPPVRVYFAPAMDLDMYKHPATRNNLMKLNSYGNIIIPPEEGELASGLLGEGRMAEPETIFKIISEDKTRSRQKPKECRDETMSRLKVLVTAGPTHEPIDPVRFIANRSSGKMGFAIAGELANRGAKVKLVCGPVSLSSNHPNISRVDVTSAREMYDECMHNFPETDIAVMCAAVADWSPQKTEKQKIKKSSKNKSLQLTHTIDILAELGKIKSKEQILVGFALETDNEIDNAKTKLKRKNLDLIILNSMNDSGAGFYGDTNKVTIIDKNNKATKFELKPKSEVAKDIVDKIYEKLGK